MVTLTLLGVVVGLGTAVGIVRFRRAGARVPTPPSRPPRDGGLAVGDVIQHLGDDHLLESGLRLVDGDLELRIFRSAARHIVAFGPGTQSICIASEAEVAEGRVPDSMRSGEARLDLLRRGRTARCEHLVGHGAHPVSGWVEYTLLGDRAGTRMLVIDAPCALDFAPASSRRRIAVHGTIAPRGLLSILPGT